MDTGGMDDGIPAGMMHVSAYPSIHVLLLVEHCYHILYFPFFLEDREVSFQGKMFRNSLDS